MEKLNNVVEVAKATFLFFLILSYRCVGPMGFLMPYIRKDNPKNLARTWEKGMKAGIPFTALLLCIITVTSVYAQTKRVNPTAAKNHIGEQAVVCGKVVSARYASQTKGEPTFLNLDQPYPKQVFTIVIWGDDRAKFGEPESKYLNQKVCVTGKITSFRGEPEVVASNPDKLETQK